MLSLKTNICDIFENDYVKTKFEFINTILCGTSVKILTELV